MIRSTFILVCVLALAAPGPVRAQDPKLAALLDDIDLRAGKIPDLAGRFRQEKHTALLKKPLVSSGRIRMKGAVVRWDTETPEPAVLYSDGREIRMYYPRQSVVEVYPIDRRLSDLAASPLPRLAALREHFKIESLSRDQRPADERDDANRVALRLVPSDEFLAQHVDEVRVTLDARSACVVRVEMFDADGDRTLIRFSDVKIATGMKDSDLELVVPAGTKVSRPLDAARGNDSK
jgi:outer membrane lipoprotein-sorting protein